MRKILDDRKIIKGFSIRQSISDAFDRECIKIMRPGSHIIEDLIIEWIAIQVSNMERDPVMVGDQQQ